MADRLHKMAILSTLLSSSESSSDEEMLSFIKVEKITRINHFLNVVHKYTEEEFRENFRLHRSTCENLIENFKNSQVYKQCENRKGGRHTISAEKHILSFLGFAVNKSTIREVSHLFNTSVSTFYLICDRVMDYLHNIACEIIKFPKTENELQALATAFENISGIPNVIGCVDGSYIRIRTPAHKIKSTYTNRHHQTALTLQGICDNRKKFIDVFTGISSKMHDARVFQLSFISNSLPAICGNRYHILGDSAYPLSQTLITPFRDYGNLTNAQRNFNMKFSQTRVLIENSFGLLKGRFRQLIQLDFHSVYKSSRFIISCCVLHNLCIDANDVWNEEVQDPFYDIEHIQQRRDLSLRLGEQKRNELCNNLG